MASLSQLSLEAQSTSCRNCRNPLCILRQMKKRQKSAILCGIVGSRSSNCPATWTPPETARKADPALTGEFVAIVAYAYGRVHAFHFFFYIDGDFLISLAHTSDICDKPRDTLPTGSVPGGS